MSRGPAWLRMTARLTMVAGLFVAVGIPGCGGSQHATAPVHGKVTQDGQPVSGGSVTFVPLGGSSDKMDVGKPAAGEVQSDGSYTLTTYKEGDGAVVGRHRVSYSPPPSSDGGGGHAEEGKQPPPPKTETPQLVPKQTEVEVKAGDNQIDIELVPPSGN